MHIHVVGRSEGDAAWLSSSIYFPPHPPALLPSDALLRTPRLPAFAGEEKRFVRLRVAL